MEFSALVGVFRSSIARPTDTPVYASTNTSRCSLQDSGPRWIRFSFLVGLFHSQQHAGSSRRTPVSATKSFKIKYLQNRRIKLGAGRSARDGDRRDSRSSSM